MSKRPAILQNQPSKPAGFSKEVGKKILIQLKKSFIFAQVKDEIYRI